MFTEVDSIVGSDNEKRIDWSVLILSLPNELLCFVFEIVARAERPCGIHHPIGILGRPNRNEALGFLRLSEVCTQFRAVLLSIPALWATVVFHLPTVPARLALARSQSVPLNVYIHPSSDWMVHGSDPWFELDREGLCALASEHAARVGSITVYNLESKEYENLFSNQLPLLEYLALEHTYPTPQSTSDHACACIDAPNLDVAHITALAEGCLFSARHQEVGLSFKLPALRGLEVDLVNIWRKRSLKLGWLVDVLQNSSLIENLRVVLDDQYDTVGWDDVLDGRVIELTRLRALELVGSSAADMISFYKHICTTRPARFKATIKDPLKDDEDMLEFVNSFGPMLRHSSHSGLMVQLRYKHLSHTLDVAAFPALDGPIRCSSGFPKSMLEGVHFSFQSSIPSTRPVHRQIVDTLAAAIANSEFKQLIVDAVDSKAWSLALQPIVLTCAAVAELVVRHPWDSHTLDFPIPVSSDILPSLRALLVEPIVVAEDSFCAWWEALIAWLERRAHVGPRIRYLHVLRPEFPPGTDIQGQETIHKAMCVRAAAFVDEMLDERASWD